MENIFLLINLILCFYYEFVGFVIVFIFLLSAGVFKNLVRTHIYAESKKAVFFTSYDIYGLYTVMLFFIIIVMFDFSFFSSFSAFDTLYFFDNSFSTFAAPHFFYNSVGAVLLKQIFLGLMIFFSFAIFRVAEAAYIPFQEIVFLLLGYLLFSMTLLMATNLISIFLSLEFLCLFIYILAAFFRFIPYLEACLYFCISNVPVWSLFFLGIGFFYHTLGTFDFCYLNYFFYYLQNVKGDNNTFIALGCLFLFLYFACRLLIAPFNLVLPFIYFGAPVAAAILFGVISKFVIFTPLLRISVLTISVYPYFAFFFLFLGFFIFIYGGVRVLFTNRLKFVLIYSSMNQVGVPICLVGFNIESACVLIYFFVIIYSLVSIVAWIAYVQLLTQQYKVNEYIVNTELKFTGEFSEYFFKDVPDKKKLARKLSSPLFLSSLSGLWFINRSLALKFIFVFFSFASFPFLIGFLTKSFIFYLILEMDSFLWVVVFGFFGSFIAIYYLRLIKIIFDKPNCNFYTNPNTVLSFSFLELLESLVEDGLCLLVISLLFVLFLHLDTVIIFGYQPVYYLFFGMMTE